MEKPQHYPIQEGVQHGPHLTEHMNETEQIKAHQKASQIAFDAGEINKDGLIELNDLTNKVLRDVSSVAMSEIVSQHPISRKTRKEVDEKLGISRQRPSPFANGIRRVKRKITEIHLDSLNN